jgi:hypothetical protein
MSKERELPGSITFYFNGVVRSVSIEETSMLSDWLHRTRVNAAQSLAQRLQTELTKNAAERADVELDSAARAVLRDILSNVDLSEYARLKGLALVLQGEIWNQPLEGERSLDAFLEEQDAKREHR